MMNGNRITNHIRAFLASSAISDHCFFPSVSPATTSVCVYPADKQVRVFARFLFRDELIPTNGVAESSILRCFALVVNPGDALKSITTITALTFNILSHPLSFLWRSFTFVCRRYPLSPFVTNSVRSIILSMISGPSTMALLRAIFGCFRSIIRDSKIFTAIFALKVRHTWIIHILNAMSRQHMGSGSIAIAAHYAGMHLTACELDEDYFKAACKRIERETSQTTLNLEVNATDAKRARGNEEL